MLIDFCHHSVGSLIKTDKVSFDGYEVNNLITSNPLQKNKGFLSDHFVKPPVNITVQFPCNISLYRVVIDPVIGQQKSHDLKIFTASTRLTDTWLYGGNNTNVLTDGLIFNHVSYVSQSNPKIICLENKLFHERKSWTKDAEQNYTTYSVTDELRSRKPGALSNTSHVTICVMRTQSGCSAAIKRLEIWGIPSSAVPYEVQMKLKQSYMDSVFPRSSSNTSKQKTSEVSDTVDDFDLTPDKAECSDSLSVPDEFKDQITFDIMACPVLLPSGKNIDQSSLDKFINTEASWGRPPSDPFTGLEFTQGRQPIANTALKARIDEFTFKHSDSLTVAKTLGQSNRFNSNLLRSSRLAFSQAAHDRNQLDSSAGSQSNSTTSLTIQSSKKVSQPSKIRKRKFFEDQNEEAISKHSRPSACTNTLESSEINEKQWHNDPAQQDGKAFVKTNQDFVSAKHSHKDVLTCSLDDALKNALGGLPSFVSKSQTCTIQSSDTKSNDIRIMNCKDRRKHDVVCTKCGIDCAKPDVIKYKIPCGHLICRNCVNICHGNKDDMSCATCNMDYSRENLVRVF